MGLGAQVCQAGSALFEGPCFKRSTGEGVTGGAPHAMLTPERKMAPYVNRY